ncbi:hypothetical protein BHM03_00052456 [Ensete ventricosum]|nr:hypothetical protein BHM03_00052456 [Ensete ventricosum]
MVLVLLVPQPESDLGVMVMFRSLLHCGSRIGFARRGAVTSKSRPTDNNIDLFLYGPLQARLGGREKSFLLDLEKNLHPSRSRGVEGGLGNGCSGLSILEGLERYPRDCSVQGGFWLSCFLATKTSTTMYWFARCSISGTIVGGHSTNDQKNLDVQAPSKKACSSGRDAHRVPLESPSQSNLRIERGVHHFLGSVRGVKQQWACAEHSLGSSIQIPL